jgi:hypothetical protein
MVTNASPIRSRFIGLLFLGVFLATSLPAGASPPDTVWVEDIHLHPSGPAELHFGYERGEAPDGGVQADLHRLIVRTAVGFDRAPIDFMPTFGLVQLGAEPARLDHLGLRLRYRLAGTPSQPRAGLVLAYQAPMTSGGAHVLEQGLIGRWGRGALSVTGDVRVSEALGSDSRVEVRAGAAATVGGFIGLVRGGVEAFALVPLTGARITDAGLGAADDPAVYLGPSLRLHAEYLWLSASAVTGRIGDKGAPLLLRVILGTQF